MFIRILWLLLFLSCLTSLGLLLYTQAARVSDDAFVRMLALAMALPCFPLAPIIYETKIRRPWHR